MSVSVREVQEVIDAVSTANGSIESMLGREREQKLLDEMAALASLGFPIALITDVDDADGSLTYKIEMAENVCATVRMVSSAKNEISLLVQEEGSSNLVSFDEQGNVFLDGELVEFTMCELQDEERVEAAFVCEDECEPRSKQFVACISFNDPLHGKAEYVYRGKHCSGNLKLPVTIAKLTVGALVLIASAFMTRNGGMAVKATKHIVSFLSLIAPASKIVSFRQKTYEPKNKSEYAGKFTGVAKSKTTYFAKKNCSGKGTSEVTYVFTAVY